MTQESAMRWNTSRFRRFETIPFSGDHYGAFDAKHISELTDILRGVLKDII